ncbi:cysteine proteinase [Backusella circina FSU 941]|nr:cysteine proteinase [Backusella circina FSU 941]
MRPGQHGVASEHKNAVVQFRDLYKLNPGTWLNGEVINFYMALLKDRADGSQVVPNVHCFSTYFYEVLKKDHSRVHRWTKKVDIFSKDILLVPINENHHWLLGVIDMRNRRVYVYDSLGKSHPKMLRILWSYLENEHQHKKKAPFDYRGWERMTLKNVPQQLNTTDCGVFICTFAERLSRDGEIDFHQNDMPKLRQGMVLDILNKQL